jgi:hypothetical protein
LPDQDAVVLIGEGTEPRVWLVVTGIVERRARLSEYDADCARLGSLDWLVAAFKGKRSGFARTTRIGHSLTIEPATAAVPRGKHSSIDLDQVPFGPEATTITALYQPSSSGLRGWTLAERQAARQC